MKELGFVMLLAGVGVIYVMEDIAKRVIGKLNVLIDLVDHINERDGLR